MQTNEVFDDGTTFVEKGLLFEEEQILNKYKKLKQSVGGVPSREQLRKFVDENFVNDSLPVCDFEDYNPNPSILKATDKEKYQSWLRWLNNRWREMGGQVSDDVKKNPNRHSFLWVPNKFVKAGGRFTGEKFFSKLFKNLIDIFSFEFFLNFANILLQIIQQIFTRFFK